MRKLVASISLLLSATCLFAQEGLEFNHSLGGKYFGYAKSDGVSSTTLLYSPRLNVSTAENSAISVGTHLALGFSLYSGPMGSSTSFVYDLPIVCEYNLGFGSSKDNESGFGGYAGAGYGLHHLSIKEDGYGGSATLHGPVFTGGFRFNAGIIGALEIGASYMIDLKSKDQKTNIFGISLSYLFGMSRNY